MINHLCAPNSMVQFIQQTAALRAERSIAAGGETETSDPRPCAVVTSDASSTARHHSVVIDEATIALAKIQQRVRQQMIWSKPRDLAVAFSSAPSTVTSGALWTGRCVPLHMCLRSDRNIQLLPRSERRV